jgi:hypothetical protein
MNPATDWIPTHVAMPTSNDLIEHDGWLYVMGFSPEGGYDANGWRCLTDVILAIGEKNWTHWKRIAPVPK